MTDLNNTMQHAVICSTALTFDAQTFETRLKIKREGRPMDTETCLVYLVYLEFSYKTDYVLALY